MMRRNPGPSTFAKRARASAFAAWIRRAGVFSIFLRASCAPLAAQQRGAASDTAGVHLSPAAQGAVELYNAAGTKRVNGAFDVPATDVVTGDVAVINGPVTIEGRIEGSLVAINADVRFAPGARIDRRLVILGGGVGGSAGARVDGGTLTQVELLRYHLDGERIVPEREPEYDDTWWKRHHEMIDDLRHGEAYTDFFYAASRAYNRVEGWSSVVGPRFQRFTDWGRINIEAFAVARTASPVTWGERTIGDDLRAEVQFGKPIGVAAGAHAFDVVEPVESWQMENGEVGLASLVLHRDFRDYYGRHGGEGFLRFEDGKQVNLTLSVSSERWNDLRDRDPWTILRNDEAWRPNPFMDQGDMHLLDGTFRLDTRDGEGSALSGWFVTGNLEQGTGALARFGDPVNTNPLTGTPFPTSESPVHYTRGFVDARRYNRISRWVSFNARLVAGGSLGGDPLPSERRFSLGGPGTLPGFGFREKPGTPDVLNCSSGVAQLGRPGECERMVLAQFEVRSRLLWSSLRDDASDDWWRPGFNGRMQWVMFADAGRGWLVGPQDGGVSYPSALLPPLSTFKADAGIGIDFGGLGFYTAKALSDGAEPLRFIVRLERRF